MIVRRAAIEELELPLVEPFETSFGTQRRRRLLLVELEEAGGAVGLGECVAAEEPRYSGETTATARWMLRTHLLPAAMAGPLATPGEFLRRVEGLREHRMAKAAVEGALYDLAAQEGRLPLSRLLGGTRRRVEVGVSVGIQPDLPALVRRVGAYLEEGYRRVKLKIRPGWDDAPVAAIRSEFPDLRIWVDANRAYGPRDAPRLARLARRGGVEQVEQPFDAAALGAHARLARRAPFRVCLDESVVDRPSLSEAIERRALTSLNVKPGRVGGLGVGLALAREARRARITSWVGGMLETGVGRAHLIALASAPVFTLPGDLSASRRYYEEDLIDRPFELGPGGTLEVPTGPGIGVRVDERIRERARRGRWVVPPPKVRKEGDA